jgi:hypothetical protein
MTTRLTLTARTIKVTVPLNAAEVKALPASDESRCQLAIACEGKVYTADIATKSLRKAKGTISANGAANVFVMVQGKLRGNEIVECGLVTVRGCVGPRAPSHASAGVPGAGATPLLALARSSWRASAAKSAGTCARAHTGVRGLRLGAEAGAFSRWAFSKHKWQVVSAR